jgi:hypothetical protein
VPGRRMTIRNHRRAGALVPDYQCMASSISAGVTPCLRASGAGVDAALSQLVLDSVSPLALEVALGVQDEVEKRAQEAQAIRRSHVQRAAQRAELARRRYLGVDPGNRLVPTAWKPTGTTPCGPRETPRKTPSGPAMPRSA